MQVLTAADMTALQRLENIQLLYPVDMFGSLPEYPTFTEPFILQLEEFLGVKRVNINIRERFKEEQLAGGKSTDEILSQVSLQMRRR